MKTGVSLDPDDEERELAQSPETLARSHLGLFDIAQIHPITKSRGTARTNDRMLRPPHSFKVALIR